MAFDLLGAGQLIGGLVAPVAAAVDPYVYTGQEQARDALAGQQLAAQQSAITANQQMAADREETSRKAITYGLAGVLGVSALFIAGRALT